MSSFDPTTFFENPEVGRLIPLTNGYWTIVDEEDFEWLSQFKWIAHKPGKKTKLSTPLPQREPMEKRQKHTCTERYWD